ncbi:hypothetical protein [Dysgonomonas termitidis]|uniref:Uncharacterized protein n=1 Tax=Dysgonomonas termitidis TaxID=1516126 RepID=A0ABV9L5S7_9BACT
MAYNKEYLLLKIIEIQNVVLEEKKKGWRNQKQIYEELIAPKYFISKSTFDKYLGRNAKKELAELKERNRLKDIAAGEREKVIDRGGCYV